MGSKKKVVELKPFHEVAFEILERRRGEDTEGLKKLDKWLDHDRDAVVIVVAFLLTRCIVPEKEQSRIVQALIAATKYSDCYVTDAVALALTHFKPGKKGLKELWKLISAEYLTCEEDSDEANGRKELFYALELEAPKRPEKEEAKAPEKKSAAKKPAPKGGGKKKPSEITK